VGLLIGQRNLLANDQQWARQSIALCEDGNNGHGNDNGYDCSNPGTSNNRIVYTPGVFCPLWDPWGIINYNDSHNVQCIPVPHGPWASTYEGEMLW
jgi:hypothetical protein